MYNDKQSASLASIVLVTLFGLVIIIALVVGWQWFKVFSATMSGRAVLSEAEYSRQVAVKEAQAKKDSASLLAEAEILRARGVAESNQIIGEGLKGNEEYLRYLWIQGLVTNQQQVIYVPTEAGLPILEAGKR